MDSKIENYLELWAAKRAEYDAKADMLEAEVRMEYNDLFDNFDKEVEAAADWTEAAWDQLLAKADQEWQKLALRVSN